MVGAILEIVNDDDAVIGVRERADIHSLGLRHREVHVWFVTDKNDIIFQRRSATKDTFSSLLDATVGGHVDIGQTYEQAALMEIAEEAGITASRDQILPLVKLKILEVDTARNKKNAPFRQIYWLRYHGTVEDLQIEKDDGAGFVTIPAERVFQMTPTDCDDCIPSLFKPDYMPAWGALRACLGKE
jgi:8-oxo-dGTP pyrophosphatase MutT (NUDIX family)